MSNLGKTQTNSKGQTIKCAKVGANGKCSAWVVISGAQGSTSSPAAKTGGGKAKSNSTSRVVVLGGTAVLKRADNFGDVVGFVTKKFKEANWDIIGNITFTSAGYFSDKYNISLQANVLNSFTAEQARQSATDVLANIKEDNILFANESYFTEISLGVMADKAEFVASYNKDNDGGGAGGGGDNKDKSDDGILGNLNKWVSEGLFGKPVDIFGLQVPKTILYGLVGFLVYGELTKNRNGSGGGGDGDNSNRKIYLPTPKNIAKRLI